MKFSTEKFQELFQKEKIGSWIVKHKKQVAAGCILVCLVIAAAAGLGGKGKTGTSAKAGQSVDADGAAQDAEIIAKVEEEENDLKKNAYPEVNELVQKYYDCLSYGDMETLSSIVDVISEDEKNRILSSRDIVESYQNIDCYTKKGLEKDSYVVFVYYEQKFQKYETLAPGLSALYVCTGDDGNLFISNGELDQSVLDYVKQLAQGEDVQALRDEVTAKYEAAKEEEPKLAGLENIKNTEEEAPAEEAPAEEAPAEEAEQEAPAEEAPAEEAPAEEPAKDTASASQVNKDTRFTESVKLRAGRGTDTEYLGTAYQGEHVTQIENYSDGWSKIQYNGKECYCKTEFLE